MRSVVAALLFAGLLSCASPRPTEFVNITFTPSVDTDDYRTWDFELASCRGFEDARIDDDFLHAELLAAIEAGLAERGYGRRPGEPVHFTVFYQLWIADGGDLAGVDQRIRGRIFLRDVATQRLVWRGERKVPLTWKASTPEQQIAEVRRFTADLLQYTIKLEEPEEQDD